MPHRLMPLFKLSPGGLTLALAAGWFADVLRGALDLYSTLLATDPVLLLVGFTLVIIDLPLGVWTALTKGGGFSFRRFDPSKAAGWAGKFVRYAVTVAVCALIANASESQGAIGWAVAGLDEAALLSIIAVEFGSVMRHLHGAGAGVRQFFARVRVFLPGSDAAEAADAIVEIVEKEEGLREELRPGDQAGGAGDG